MLIEAKNISVEISGEKILRDVSLEVNPQDFITIIGPNGAGKSMLLKALMGFYQVTSGKVIKKTGLKIGYMPQKFSANQSLPISVLEFIRLGKSSTLDEIKKIAEECSISEILDKQLHILSNGQVQRVLLARALIDSPEILILDEPAQNLDVTGQLAFYKLLEKIYETRKTAIIMISHDLHLVMASSNHVICLYQHVCCSGEAQAVAKDPEFISLFGDDMAKMMAVYNHDHDHEHEKNHIHSDECNH